MSVIPHNPSPREAAGEGRVKGLRRFGLAAGSVVGALLALDLIGFVATVWFSAELAAAAEAAGLAGWVAL